MQKVNNFNEKELKTYVLIKIDLFSLKYQQLKNLRSMIIND